MSDHDLATLVREHVTADEPPFLLSAGSAIALGRRTLVRRRARRGLAGVIVAAAAAAAVFPALHSSAPSDRGGDLTGIDPATAAALEHYDARRMPAILDHHVRAALGHGIEDLGQPEFTASDDQGEKLPPRYYDKASAMSVAYGGDGPHRVRVTLLHARGEAEGDARKNCARDVEGGIDFSCTVTTSPAGDTVTTMVRAIRPLKDIPGDWGLVTPEELRTGIPAATSPGGDEPINPDEVYFERSVEVVHSETFLTTATEIVKAPDLATANRFWTVPVADLETVVTDPELVIPKPPLGSGGCPWTWHAKVTCSG